MKETNKMIVERNEKRHV